MSLVLPRWVFNPTKKPMIVNNEEEFNEALTNGYQIDRVNDNFDVEEEKPEEPTVDEIHLQIYCLQDQIKKLMDKLPQELRKPKEETQVKRTYNKKVK